MLRQSAPIGTKVFNEIHGIGILKEWKGETAIVRYNGIIGNYQVPRKLLTEFVED